MGFVFAHHGEPQKKKAKDLGIRAHAYVYSISDSPAREFITRQQFRHREVRCPASACLEAGRAIHYTSEDPNTLGPTLRGLQQQEDDHRQEGGGGGKARIVANRWNGCPITRRIKAAHARRSSRASCSSLRIPTPCRGERIRPSSRDYTCWKVTVFRCCP